MAEARQLAASARPAQRRAFERLTRDLEASREIRLVGLVARNRAANATLAGHGEATSEQRRELIDLDHALALPLLIRRWLYLAAEEADPTLAGKQACGARNLGAFL